MDISQLTKDLDAAVKAAQTTKGVLDKAQAMLDKAKEDYEVALTAARDLHGSLKSQLAELIPGLSK